MSLITQKYINGLSSAYVEPNTFVGGVGGHLSTLPQWAYRMIGVDESDIKNFQIDANNNVSFFVDKDYTMQEYSFNNIDEMTYFYDIDNHCKSVGYRAFQNISSRIKMHATNIITLKAQGFKYSYGAVYWRYPNLTQLLTGYQNYYGPQVKRFYVPLGKLFGDQSTVGQCFHSHNYSGVIYIHPDMATSNGGVMNAELAWWPGTKVFVTDFTPPSNVTDLSSSNITVNSVDLNFTAPASTNTLDFYEVWIDDGSIEWRYHVFSEITASGQTVSGLASGTTYKIKIVVCDEFWNRSEFSNEIEITTL